MCLCGKDDIKKYFKNYIFKWIFKDIENCIKAKANYTIALALTSYTEFLGGLITGTLGIPNKGAERFKAALKYFDGNDDSGCYQSFKIRFRDIDFQVKDGDIYSLFRCGLAHEYFVKGDSFIHNNPDGTCNNGDKGVGLIDEQGGKRLRFHTNAYFRDFKEACNKYYKDLLKACENGDNKELLDNYFNSLERIAVRKILF